MWWKILLVIVIVGLIGLSGDDDSGDDWKYYMWRHMGGLFGPPYDLACNGSSQMPPEHQQF